MVRSGGLQLSCIPQWLYLRIFHTTLSSTCSKPELIQIFLSETLGHLSTNKGEGIIMIRTLRDFSVSRSRNGHTVLPLFRRTRPISIWFLIERHTVCLFLFPLWKGMDRTSHSRVRRCGRPCVQRMPSTGSNLFECRQNILQHNFHNIHLA
jgi:hypothetical protein